MVCGFQDMSGEYKASLSPPLAHLIEIRFPAQRDIPANFGARAMMEMYISTGMEPVERLDILILWGVNKGMFCIGDLSSGG